MSEVVNSLQIGRTLVCGFVAVVALVLTSIFDWTLGAPEADGAIAVDVPTGGRWCGPQDGLGARTCRFQTFEHCLTAASAFGPCRPNLAAALIPDDRPYRTYRSLAH